MRTLQDILDSLPSNRREAILDRAEELLAQELTLTVRFPDRPPIELQGIGNADAG